MSEVPLTNDINYNTKKDFEPLPKGVYPVEIEDVKLEKFTSTKTGQSWMCWKMRMNILSGPYAGRKIFDNKGITAKAAAYIGNMIEAVIGDINGMTLQEEKGLILRNGIPMKPSDIVGARVNVEIYVKGKYNNVKSYSKIDDVQEAGNQTVPF